MKKSSIIAVVVLIILLVTGVGFWKWKSGKDDQVLEENKSSNNNGFIDENIKLSSEPKIIIQQLKEVFFNSAENTNAEIRDNICFSWAREDGINFGPKGGWSVDSGRANRDSVKNDIVKISSLFNKNGFTKSDINYKNIQEVYGMAGENFGFEKENLKCLISWSENTTYKNDPLTEIFGVSCAKIDAESEKDFNDIFPAFKKYIPTAGYSKFEDVNSFCIKKKDDKFAMGLVGKISAPEWYAKKENGEWIVTMITQDHPLCNRIKGFPTDYYGGKCLYTDGQGKVQIREMPMQK